FCPNCGMPRPEEECHGAGSSIALPSTICCRLATFACGPNSRKRSASEAGRPAYHLDRETGGPPCHAHGYRLRRLFTQTLNLLSVRLARVGCDALVGRFHFGSERRKIRAGDRKPCRLELLDLVRLVVADQLAHERARRGTFLTEDSLLVGCQLSPAGR